jgi:hypothetical protein
MRWQLDVAAPVICSILHQGVPRPLPTPVDAAPVQAPAVERAVDHVLGVG